MVKKKNIHIKHENTVIKKNTVSQNGKSLQELLSATILLIRQKPHAFAIGFVVLLVATVSSTSVAISMYAVMLKQKNTIQEITIQQPTLTLAITPVTIPSVLSPTSVLQRYYIVAENERLWDIANKVYGDPYKYTKLVELNHLTNPDAVPAGTKLLVE